MQAGGGPNQIFTTCSSKAFGGLNIGVALPDDSAVLFVVLG